LPSALTSIGGIVPAAWPKLATPPNSRTQRKFLARVVFAVIGTRESSANHRAFAEAFG